MQKQKTVTYFAKWLNRELTIPVVEKIPADHVVWFIGDNAPAGYVMACTVNGHNINPETLKAIRVTDADKKTLNRAAAWGNTNLVACKKTIATPDIELDRGGWCSYFKGARKESAINALPIFERITDATNPTADTQGASCRLQEAVV